MSEHTFPELALAETCSLITDGSHFSPTPQEDGHPIVNAKDIPAGKVELETCTRISDRDYQLLCSQNCAPKVGDVLLSKDGTIGRVVHYKEDLGVVALSSVAILRPEAKLDSDFLAHSLRSHLFEKQLFGLQSGSALKRLILGDIRKIRVPVPPAHTQRRIAEILTTLDEEIEATEALIAKHQQIKAGLMHDLFTRGLWTQAELDRGDHKGLPSEASAKEGQLRPTPEEAPGLYQETEIGLFPKAWKIDLLDAFAKRGSGHTPNRHNPAYWNGGVKWVSLADSFRLDQLYISDTDKEISQLGIENSSAVLHPPGIVVLSRDAGVGKSAITTCPMAVSQHFMCWLCGPELDNHYLYYWLQDQKRVFENISTGTTIPTIGLGFFRRYKIAVPSAPEEQQKIRSSLLSCDESLFAHQDDLAKLRQQKQGLMQDLLTGQVRVDGLAPSK